MMMEEAQSGLWISWLTGCTYHYYMHADMEEHGRQGENERARVVRSALLLAATPVSFLSFSPSATHNL